MAYAKLHLCEKREKTVKKLTKHFLLALGLCLLMAGSASADLLFLNGYHYSDGGIVVGPVHASFGWNGGTSFDIFCNDYKGATYIGDSFYVNRTNLLDVGASGSPVRFPQTGGAATLIKYKQAGWLVTQMYAYDTKSDNTNIQHALWYLFSNEPASDAGILYWYNLAVGLDSETKLAGTNIDFSSFEVLTPDATLYARNVKQEFIKWNRVPEPAMLGTLLFGLVGVGLFSRKRYKAV